MQMTSHWLGSLDYGRSLELQKQLREKVRRVPQRGFVLACEHPPVITLGLRGSSQDIAESSSLPQYRIDRGGQATLHSPGQLVIYPVVNVRGFGIGAKKWVESLLITTQKTLEICNIRIVDSSNGLFTQSGKIASIGLNLKGGISSHGIAINIRNNLELFEKIRPCGIQNQAMDSVNQYKDITLDGFFRLWCKSFSDLFAVSLTENTAELSVSAF